MIRPGSPDYNQDPMYINEKYFDSVTIDELIASLQTAKEVLGGDCICMMAYDGGAGYDNIRTIHGQDLNDNLICTLSCCSHIGKDSDLEERKIKIYCDALK